MFHLYGLLLGIGIITGFSAAEKAADTPQRELLQRVALWMGIGALIGARVYHLVTDWQLYVHASFIDLVAIWNGGLGIYGAVAGTVIGAVFYLWKYKKLTKLYVFTLLDLLAFGLPLGQAIGRWGNYLNHELFGLPTTLPWGLFIPVEFRPDAYIQNTHFHPLFLYESIAMLILWVALWKRRFKVGTGKTFAVYLIYYGFVRFFLDFLRIHAVGWGNIQISQTISLLMICGGLAFLYMRGKKSAKI